MDITKYKKYIRDLEISDTELIDLIKTVINDIARDTLIFKDLFIFHIEECIDSYYNIENLYDITQTTKSPIISNIEISSTISDPDSLSNYINSLNIVSENEDACITEDNTIDVNITENNVTANNIYLSTNDLIYTEFDITKNILIDYRELLSVHSRWFNQINNSIYLLNKTNLFKDTIYIDGSKYDIPILGIVNIVPDLENITEKDELIIQHAIIEGIKYFLSDSYMNAQNTQTANILYQRYYSTKRQLKYNYVNNISLADRYRRF